jgi:hypothetical protein
MSAQMQARRWLHPVTHDRPARSTERTWQGYLAWIVAAALIGLATTAVFSGVLELDRDLFLVAYIAVTAPFLVAFTRWSGIEVGELARRHLRLGLVGAVITGGIMVAAVQRMDPSPRAQGADLFWDILWLGVVYGIVDALLLNVLPIVSVWRASALLGHMTSWTGKIVTGAVGLAASMVVTTAYHLGYAEFRGDEVVDPLIGNSIMSLGYLVFGNPITAIVAHIALHVASVIHGVDTTVTLPPHY